MDFGSNTQECIPLSTYADWTSQIFVRLLA